MSFQETYAEKLAMMDNQDYAHNTYQKLEFYTAHGIIPSINLITTYETKEQPLSSEYVEKIIQYYFL